MHLLMTIGNVIAEKVTLNYKGLNSTAERQQYQEQIARELYQKHERLLTRWGIEPEFYVEGVPSRLNQNIYDQLK
jgi:hypothetical protein